MQCPEHAVPLHLTNTRYGVRGACPVDGCTVVGWDGPTSTPADAVTRTLRREAHDSFDPLWKNVRERSALYAELAAFLCLPVDYTHIGMFNAEQCRRVLLFCANKRKGL